MRRWLFVGVVSGPLVLLAACGTAAETADAPRSSEDAGGSSEGSSSSSSSGFVDASGDTASSTLDAALDADGDGETSAANLTTPQTTMLRAGVVTLIGLTTGPTPHAVFHARQANGNFNVEAVPVGGGPFVSLWSNVADPSGVVVVRGGAVARVATDGALSVWTQPSGLKSIPGPILLSTFAATEDGARVLFGRWTNPARTVMDVVVTGSLAPTTVPALQDAAWADLAFVGQNVVGSYRRNNATHPRLVTIAPGTQPRIVVDDETAAPSDRFDFHGAIDSTGTKIVVYAADGSRLVRIGPANVDIATFDPGRVEGQFTNDGSMFVFRTEGAVLKKVQTAGSIVPTSLASDVSGFQLASSSTHALVGVHPLLTNFDELQTLDLLAAAPVPVAIGTTRMNDVLYGEAGLSGSGAFAAYVEDGANTFTIKSKRVDGTGGAMLANGGWMYRAPEGDVVLLALSQGVGSVSMSWVDLSKGTAPQPLAMLSNLPQGMWTRKTFVYSASVGGVDGLYATRVP